MQIRGNGMAFKVANCIMDKCINEVGGGIPEWSLEKALENACFVLAI